METVFGLVVLIVAVSIFIWARNAFWKAANQKVFARKGHARGQSAVTSKSTFVVPGSSAADVVHAVVSTLGYPTTKPAVAPTMVLVGATETQAIFARASRLSQSWESCLRVVDESDGASGDYGVVRWTLVDGIAAGWQEMEIVERRVGEIVTNLGGTVTVTGQHDNRPARPPSVVPSRSTPASNGTATSICPDCSKVVAGNAWGLHRQHCAGRKAETAATSITRQIELDR
jgi:hypothetical protein